MSVRLINLKEKSHCDIPKDASLQYVGQYRNERTFRHVVRIENHADISWSVEI